AEPFSLAERGRLALLQWRAGVYEQDLRAGSPRAQLVRREQARRAHSDDHSLIPHHRPLLPAQTAPCYDCGALAMRASTMRDGCQWWWQAHRTISCPWARLEDTRGHAYFLIGIGAFLPGINRDLHEVKRRLIGECGAQQRHRDIVDGNALSGSPLRAAFVRVAVEHRRHRAQRQRLLQAAGAEELEDF